MTHDLDGQRILVVEDEAIIAMDLNWSLSDHGAEVVIARSLADANSLNLAAFDLAVLDIDVGDGLVWPVANALQALDVPFLFHSATCREDGVGFRFPGVPFLTKPAGGARLIEALVEAATARTKLEAVA
ncbi:response regulator [Parvularcula dongshanensis]|uniref:DNA-binding response OmpR family regulator n=1 Tax=Parvularcula dongshanensis TaxID=1173995 RepID=A0A840I2H0_9PROT|nr:response regulator [Parvularcula dongshanensis]MBB4658481.1 DNA-binding response OmpR family regulator [Parvularcula dongshanensis]